MRQLGVFKSNDNCDGTDKNSKKAVRLVKKTTSHVHHTFLYIS